MKRVLTPLTLLLYFVYFNFFTASGQPVEKYSRMKVYAGSEQYGLLAAKGIALDELAAKTATYFIADFSATEIAVIKQAGLRMEFLIRDLTEDFLKRNNAAKEAAEAMARTGGTPPGFSYGSMGGYLTYNEMVAELDELKAMYPNLITAKTSIGNSLEGRPLWMVKISDNPDMEEPAEQGVVYSGLTHAREPLSMVSLIYFMQYILSKYGTDPEITCLINNRELYFIPCLNPDGYVYNQTTNPNGGGYWRKNRRNNGDGTYGVDLNRNFSYQWGYDNSGSSPTTSSETYRGTAAASEPEIAAFQDYISGLQLTTGLNYHTYSNKLILPFSYNDSPTPIDAHYTNVASMLTYENEFPYGRVMQMLGYNVNGNSDDWMYGARNIISFTPELGPETEGFWPVQSQIIPICESVLDMNISIAWAADRYIKPGTPADNYVSGYSYSLPISTTNYGNAAGTIETVQLSISDSRVQSYDNSLISLNGLAVDATLTVNKNISFNSNATSGTLNGNLVTTNSEGCTYNVPFSFEYSPNGCFSIPPSWTAVDIGNPGLAGSSCYSNGVYTLKGSGTGVNSSSDKCHMMKLATATGVTEIKAQVLTDQNTGANARAGISIAETSNAGSRRVSLFVNPSNNKLEFQKRSSTNGNISSITVNNVGAVPRWLKIVKASGGNYYGYYSSNGTQWTYIGKQKVTLASNETAGLVVTSGSSTVLHTATFNNLAVTTPGGVITKSSSNLNTEFEKTEEYPAEGPAIYPNPGTGIFVIRLPVSEEKQSISVFDINGRQLVNETTVMNYKKLNLSHLPNGLYFIRYREGEKLQYLKFVIRK